MTCGAETAGKEQDDVAGEVADLEPDDFRADRPAEARSKRGRARTQRGNREDAVRRKGPRLLEPRRADCGAQGDVGGAKDQQRLDEPHGTNNDHAAPRDPAEGRQERMAVRGLRQRHSDRAEREDEGEERRAEPD